MKKISKIVTAIIAICLLGAMFTGCNNKPVIGIIQFGSHESLNNCYNGIIQGLKDGGIDLNDYKLEFHNSNFDSSISATQASALVSKGSKLIAAIATPSAVAAKTTADGNIPVVFCAVSDPAAVGLADAPNVTGTSDVLNFDAQLDLIKALFPDVQNIRVGVLYVVTEQNSIAQIAELERVAEAKGGFTIVKKGVNIANELNAATTSLLIENLTCITNLTDNAVAGDFVETLIEMAKDANVPVFGSEIEQVKKGCLASESLDYTELGRKTGLMMAQILLGKKTADEIEFVKVEDSFPCFNSQTLAHFGLTLPAAYADILDVKAD